MVLYYQKMSRNSFRLNLPLFIVIFIQNYSLNIQNIKTVILIYFTYLRYSGYKHIYITYLKICHPVLIQMKPISTIMQSCSTITSRKKIIQPSQYFKYGSITPTEASVVYFYVSCLVKLVIHPVAKTFLLKNGCCPNIYAINTIIIWSITILRNGGHLGFGSHLEFRYNNCVHSRIMVLKSISGR